MLAELNSGLGRPDERDRLFALSELSFRVCRELGESILLPRVRGLRVRLSVPTESSGRARAYDPRLTLAVDLYNRGIALGLATRDGKEVDLSARRLSLPFGALDLSVDPSGFNYAGNHLTNFVSLSDLKVRGLRNTYRKAGIGAALSARVEPTPGKAASRWIPVTAKVPVTAFVRFDDPRLAMSNGRLHGTVEVYDEDRTHAVQVGSYRVPLESDPSAALAYQLEGAPIWDFELAGFRRGDFRFLQRQCRRPQRALHVASVPSQHDSRWYLFMGPRRVPPAGPRWPTSCSAIRRSPRAISSGSSSTTAAIRSSCLRCGCANRWQSAKKDVDPDNKDPALNNMVVIGHSQGGLLTKMTVVDSGNLFWQN